MVRIKNKLYIVCTLKLATRIACISPYHNYDFDVQKCIYFLPWKVVSREHFLCSAIVEILCLQNAFGEEKGKFESGAAKITTIYRIPSPSHALHTLYNKKASIIDALKCTAWNMIQIIDILLDVFFFIYFI